MFHARLAHYDSAQGQRLFRLPVLGLATIAALIVMATSAAAAQASSVTGVSVDPLTPSPAGGARTDYNVHFTTTSALAAGQHITITLPSGASVRSDVNSSITVGGGASLGSCGIGPSDNIAICSLGSGKSIGASTAVTVELDGATNPAASPAGAQQTLMVATDTDSTAASASYTVVAAAPVSQPAVTNTPPTTAAGGRTDYVIGFTTSSSGGGMSGKAHSQITITLPSTASVRSDINSSITVGGGASLGNCGIGPSDNIAICSLGSTSTIAPNTAVTIELDGVTNESPAPVKNADQLTVFTTSDTVTSSPATFPIVVAQSVSQPAVTNTPPTTAAGGRTDYVIGFTTSSSGGGMSGKAHSQITITLPSTASVRSDINSSITVGGGASLGNCGIGPSDNIAICSLGSTSTIAPNTAVTVELDGVTNETATPAGGTDTLTVSTTSDTVTSIPATFPIVVAQSVSQPTVTNSSPTPAAGGRTDYVIDFTTSRSGGGMSGKAHSQITITLPSTASVRSDINSSITVGGGASLGNCGIGPSDNIAICSLGSTSTIAPNTAVTVELDGVTNETSTPAGGTDTLTISTTSDTVTSIPGNFPMVPAQSVSPLTVVLSNSTPGARANYTISFTTSSTGGMSGRAHSQITITLPSTASVRTDTNSSVTVSGGASLGNCGIGPSDNIAICSLGSTSTIAPNTTVTVELDGVTNPSSASGSPVLSVVTTSDTGLPSTSQGGPGGPPPPPPPAPTPPPSPSSTSPAVSGGAPSSSTGNGATVAGTVNPESLATMAYFEYGLDPSFRGPGASSTLYDQSTPPQQIGADSAVHNVSASLTGLVPGALYHVRLVATNSAGTTLGPDHTFTTAKAAAPPPPILGRTENAQPVSGTVFIRTASGAFVRLTGAQQIPSGAVIDAIRGTLKITTALPGSAGARDAAAKGKHPNAKAKTQSGNFGGAIFKITQAHSGLTNLSLIEGAFSGAPSYALCKAHKAADATIASTKTLQLLKSSAHGKFRTSGRYSAATVRGTVWTVADRCDGTLTHVITDSVAVTDFVRHKTIVLHGGQSYLAKAPKP